MTKGLEAIANMEYPGRMIIIGRDAAGENNVVVYAITGRSASSQARKMEIDAEKNEMILVKPTNEEELKKGNPDLLVYKAMFMRGGIAVSNGKQTEDIIANYCADRNPIKVITDALSLYRKWEYEPDAPHFTPRIGGIVTPESESAVLAILKRAENSGVIRNLYEFPLISGKGKMIATYAGKNENPLPSFEGEPLDVKLEGKNPEEVAEAVYKALGPKIMPRETPDFRVSVAAVFGNKNGEVKHHIINRCERGE